MKFWRSMFLGSVVLILISAGLAQAQNGRLHGQVMDPSGAVIPGADITLKSAAGQVFTAKADAVGAYEIKGLPAGKYTVTVTTKGFVPSRQDVEIVAGQDKKLDLPLEIQTKEEEIIVESEAARVSTNPDNNASTVIISGKDLDALSDDPDELQSELQALAGPSAGPNGGQIYIDGFTGGQLPPKSSIREIRINQNPFSAEYDRMGFGRIEILTKPGTDKFHGQFFFNDNDSIWDARNPFAANEPDFHSRMFNGNFGGPMSKKSSFLVSVERRNLDEAAVINAFVLDSNLNPVPFSQGVSNPRTRTNVSSRFDFQLTPTNTLMARYQFTDINEQNNGIGQFSLASQGINNSSTEHTFQVSDTQTIGARAVNETRFEFERGSTDQNSITQGPTVSVLGAFVNGGNPQGVSAVTTDHYELQNYTSISFARHFVRFGGRLRATNETDIATQNFNGTFTFASLAAFQATERNIQNGLPVTANGGGPSQFLIVTGNPRVSDTFIDAGLYAEDDWKIKPNMTLSYGLRFETQNNISDHGDFAPRIGFAWGLGGKKNSAPKTIIRTGFGIFYDRFGQALVLNAERLNGLNQQQFVIQSPQFFPTIPSLAGVQAASTSTYTINPNLRAPYTSQAAASVERQLTKNATLSMTYLHSQGVHQFFSVNLAPPQPGALARTAPAPQFQYESEGVFKQNQLITNINVRAGAKLTLFGYYVLNYANSDTAGPNSLPAQNGILADYGRAAFDVRNRLFLGGSIGLPHGFRASPFLVANSGSPFNITVGRDLNGDSVFNDRPAFATDLSRPSVVQTNFGAFDTNPLPGQQLIPANFGTGPAQFTLNMRLTKTIGFGPRVETPNSRQGGQQGPRMTSGPAGMERGGRGPGPGGPAGIGGNERSGQRYSVTLGISARNILNFVNGGTPVGNLTSPLFGQSNSLAGGVFNTQSANRRIDMQVGFSF